MDNVNFKYHDVYNRRPLLPTGYIGTESSEYMPNSSQIPYTILLNILFYNILLALASHLYLGLPSTQSTYQNMAYGRSQTFIANLANTKTVVKQITLKK